MRTAAFTSDVVIRPRTRYPAGLFQLFTSVILHWAQSMFSFWYINVPSLRVTLMVTRSDPRQAASHSRSASHALSVTVELIGTFAGSAKNEVLAQ